MCTLIFIINVWSSVGPRYFVREFWVDLFVCLKVISHFDLFSIWITVSWITIVQFDSADSGPSGI